SHYLIRRPAVTVIRKQYVHAFSGKTFNNRFSDSAGTAGHHCSPAEQIIIHMLTTFCSDLLDYTRYSASYASYFPICYNGAATFSRCLMKATVFAEIYVHGSVYRYEPFHDKSEKL